MKLNALRKRILRELRTQEDDFFELSRDTDVAEHPDLRTTTKSLLTALQAELNRTIPNDVSFDLSSVRHIECLRHSTSR